MVPRCNVRSRVQLMVTQYLPHRPPARGRISGFIGACLTALVAILALSAVPARLLGQTPADRAGLERFRDSLSGTADSMGLLELEKRMIERVKTDRNNAV